jgi:hypothetical protein
MAFSGGQQVFSAGDQPQRKRAGVHTVNTVADPQDRFSNRKNGAPVLKGIANLCPSRPARKRFLKIIFIPAANAYAALVH